jgi:polyhydroxyalkanoate synthesis regulator phasin
MKDYEKHKASVDERFAGVNEKIDEAMRKEEFQRMQSSIHESIDRLRSDVLRYRTEDSSALAKTVNEIWEDVKESRDEARRLSTEIWRQIEDTREKMNNQQVALARSYHTKEEISRMLDDKLDPMLSMLRNIQNPAYSGPRRRETDPL